MRNRHCRSAQNIARADQHWIAAEPLHDPVRLGCIGHMRPLRLIDSKLVEQRAEFRAVLGGIDRLRAGAEKLHAGPRQPQREIVRDLAAHAHHDAVGTLVLVQVEHRLEADLVEVQPVAHVVVGADRLRVVVEHDRLVAQGRRRLHGVDRAPVELHAGADAVGARPEHQDLLAPRRGHVASIGMVGCVQIVRVGGKLPGHGVDLREARLDAVRLARGANALRVRAGERRDSLVGESETLGVAQHPGGERKPRAREPAIHLDDRLDGMQEPAVDPGQLVNLVDAEAVAYRPRHGEDPQGRGVAQLLAQVVEAERVRVEAAHADVEHAHRFLNDFRKTAADRHHLADAFHLAAEPRRRAPELGEIPARKLAHQVIQSRLEERGGAARNAVGDLGERIAERELGGDVGEGIAGRLAGERARARQPGVDFDDAIVRALRI